MTREYCAVIYNYQRGQFPIEADFLFTGTAKRKLACLYKHRQPRLISTWIHSPKNDGQNQKVASASDARDQLSRASNQDNSFKP